MPRIIFKCRYIQDNAPEHRSNLVTYIATREGVERVKESSRFLPSTKKQRELIDEILKQFPDTADLFEFEDYQRESTVQNASEFISVALEQNLDLLGKRKNYVDYIANRPRVEKIAEHGLFSDEGKQIVLSQVAEEVAHHPGNVWIPIVSLRREDADRLGYDRAKAWMDLIRGQRNMIAEQMKIAPENLRWYGAFHNEGHHPHIHMIVYSADPHEAYVTKHGIQTMRSQLANEIFQQDLIQIFSEQTVRRDTLTGQSRESLKELADQIRTGVCENRAIEELISHLAERLKYTTGKKQYGYLKAPLKSVVDRIVDELAKDDKVAKAYEKWYEMRNEVLHTYADKLPPPLPFSQQKEFASIKNMVIQEAMTIGENRFTFEPDDEADSTQESPEHLPEPVENAVDIVEDSGVPEDSATGDELPVAPKRDQKNIKPEGSPDFRIDWSKRYKQAREYLYGSNKVDQDFEKAYQLFLEEAESGNALAIFDIGRMHHDGLGRDIDEAAAQQWYAKALDAFKAVEKEKAKPYVQYRIGKMYAAGQGTEQNYTEAATWFQSAVGKRHKYAQYSLAGLYYSGKGVEQDYENAYSLYADSASQDNPYADYELAKMLRDGIGTAIDPERANRHFKIAFDGFEALEKSSRDDKLEYRIGQMLYTGTGTEKDVSAALRYFELSAKLGNVNAQYMLGKIYLDSGSAENVQKALDWLNKAAESGVPMAQYALGKLYRDGSHVEKDAVKAVDLFTKSAEQKNDYAAYALGKIYLEGKELPADIPLAVKWFSYSSELGNQFSQYTLGKLYHDGIQVHKDISKAAALLTKSAEQKNQYAAYALGKLYLEGMELPKDIDLALRWLTASSGQGNQFAQYALGKLYLADEDVARDVPKALDLLKKSALQKNQYAAYTLGKLYIDGDKVARDASQAVRWFTVSAEQENQYAAYQLGKVYLSGEDIPKDGEAAIHWLTFSAEKGNQYAQYALGKLYLIGRDVPRDKELAMQWLNASASQGNPYAQFVIDHADSFMHSNTLFVATRLMYHLSRIFREDQPRPAAGRFSHIDRKRMRELMKKKMAQGYASDDYIQRQRL